MNESSQYRVEIPWRVVEKPDHVVIEDASGVALAHIAIDPNRRPDGTPGQMTRSEALAVAQGMVADQDRNAAILRVSEMIAANQRELSGRSRTYH
ncbi:MAG: hypothetical protein K2Y56_23630 [Methylobacterium sp.]|uniref:hypothetical protein n=1 Tax=Methylobacterium sp. TaxID=409 RepID=UPI0025E2909E|nr:hypothetical protein [Methylobacterium sp.]MBX9934469.1 hypothetical protein [Methylobacterium sp.]